MVISITGVVRDGSAPPASLAPRLPFTQPLLVPRGEDLTIRLAVLLESGAAADITAGTIKLGLRKFRHDADDVVAQAAVVTPPGTGGLADIVLASALTLPLIENFSYIYDVQWTDGGGKRWQLVPASSFRIVPIVNRPSD